MEEGNQTTVKPPGKKRNFFFHNSKFGILFFQRGFKKSTGNARHFSYRAFHIILDYLQAITLK